ncbi:LPD29 domain-containing protein [Burkholderia sp. LMG 13014]|uniref:LPD29 domain-containing protein n=1 Tax=Burkholderia sp. LMG 13014 TaxID=2709306 RepID=UPI001962ED4A|nr:LPD29 domain-containing protein [Burkholderia sp. LMG 13014]
MTTATQTRYLSCAETAKLVRAALKEAFPGVKFGVRSSTYSMGASISVRWMDGPNTKQVDAVVSVFEGSYFDGSIDYKGSVHHMTTTPDGFQRVNMGADSVHTSREYSDAAIARACEAVYRRFRGNFDADGLECPTVEQYRTGALWRTRLTGLHGWNNRNIQDEVNEALYKHSFVLAVRKSATAGRYFVTHDDGYSAMCGSGHSVAPRD